MRYADTLCYFAVIDKNAAGSTVLSESVLDYPDYIESFLSGTGSGVSLLLPREEALTYKSLLTQEESLNTSKEALEVQKSSLIR